MGPLQKKWPFLCFTRTAKVIGLPFLRSDLNKGGSNESLIKGKPITLADA